MRTRVPTLRAIEITLAVVAATVLSVALSAVLGHPSTGRGPVSSQTALRSPQEALADRQDRADLLHWRASRTRRPQATPRPLRVSTPPSPKPAPAKKFKKHRAQSPNLDGIWARLRDCESSGDYREANSPPYFGAYQFDQRTWDATARRHGPEWIGVRPDHAPPSVQDRFAQALHAERGWQPWPACSRKLGLG